MIKIVTDTASDITVSQAKEMDVELVPLRVLFADTPYDQMADETFDVFYELLEASKELPTTSQPSPADFLPIFSKAKAEGDDVIVIALSGALSGTYQSACIAKELSGYDNISVIDSRTAILGQRLLVEYALRLREEGKNAQEIADIISEATGRVRIFGALETLKYLRKGGRIPKSTELIGSVLGIKPLVQLDETGAISMAGKARGHAGAVTSLLKLIELNANFDPATPVYFGYTQLEQPCRNFCKLATAKFPIKNYKQYPIGSIIGTHVGPGAVAAAFLVQSK